MTLLARTRGRLARQHSGPAGNVQDAIAGIDLGKLCHDRGPLPKQRRNEQRLVGGSRLDLSLWNGRGRVLACLTARPGCRKMAQEASSVCPVPSTLFAANNNNSVEIGRARV